MSIPPKLGMAIGIMISLPRPVDVNIGSKARMVVAVVIKQGLIRFEPASIMECPDLFSILWFIFVKGLF